MRAEVKEEVGGCLRSILRYARAKVECLASVDAVLIGRRWSMKACQLVSCSWGEGIDGTRGLHEQQWCWV